MIILGIWLAASLLFGALWALAALLLREARDRPIAAEAVEVAEEEGETVQAGTSA